MTRFLLTWELGLNLGHLARLLPVAVELKKRGHVVLVAARELSSAAYALAPAGISFVQAPFIAHGHPLPHRAAGYSDILRAQGWGDATTLRGLVEGWINLYRMFRPDVVVADYSPTAVLAAYMCGLPTLLIGNGFEIPPATEPLPPFPGFSWATQSQAASSESLVVANAVAVARALKGRVIGSLRDLLDPTRAVFATFPALDHYGERPGGEYIGPLFGQLPICKAAWPIRKNAPRLFVCVRPDTGHLSPILSTFKLLDASVICVALGFREGELTPHHAPHVNIYSQAVDLHSIIEGAHLCVSYGSEGTVATCLLNGVPSLISPAQVEAHMAARRLEALGVARVLRGEQSPDSVAGEITSLFHDRAAHEKSMEFRHRCEPLARKTVERAAAAAEFAIDSRLPAANRA